MNRQMILLSSLGWFSLMASCTRRTQRDALSTLAQAFTAPAQQYVTFVHAGVCIFYSGHLVCRLNDQPPEPSLSSPELKVERKTASCSIG